MALRKLALAAVAVVGLLVALSVVLTLVSIVVGLLYGLVVTVATLAFVALAVVGLYRVLRWSGRGGGRGDEITVDGRTTRNANADADPLERLQRRYVDGELGEAEYERRLERLLESDGVGVDETTEIGEFDDPLSERR